MSQKPANLQETLNAHRAELLQAEAELAQIDTDIRTLQRRRVERERRRWELKGVIAGIEHTTELLEAQPAAGSAPGGQTKGGEK